MKRAKDIARRRVITVTPNTPITEVARIFNENQISGCPVVDINGRLRGVISRTNILDYVLSVEGATLHPVVHLLLPEGEESLEVSAIESAEDLPEAQDLMIEDVVTVPEDMPVDDIAQVMSRERIHRVPVMRGDRVVGIITSIDLLGVFPRQARVEA